MNARSSAYWSIISQVLGFSITFANTVILAHLLTPNEFGTYGIGIAVQAIVAILTTFGISAYVTRHVELTSDIIDSAFTINAIVAIFVALTLLLCSFLTQPLLGTAAAGEVLRVLSVNSLLTIFAFRPAAMLTREMAFKALSLIGFLSVCVTTAVTIGAALMGASYMSAAWGILAGGVVQTVGYNLVGLRHVSLRLSLGGGREILRFGITMTMSSGATSVAARLSEIVLGRVQGLSALGFYGRATGITAIIQDNIYATATKISYVQMADDARRSGDLRPTLIRSLQLIVGLLWPVQIGLAITAEPVIHLVYGAKWNTAAPILSLILISQALMLMFGMNWEIFTLSGKLRQQARLEITRTAIGAVIFMICAQFSLLAAAAARIVEALVGLALYRGRVAALARTRPGELRRIYIQGGLITACAVLPAFCLMLAWGWSPLTPIEPLLTCIVIGVFFWLLALHLLKHPLRDEILTILRSSRPRLGR